MKCASVLSLFWCLELHFIQNTESETSLSLAENHSGLWMCPQWAVCVFYYFMFYCKTSTLTLNQFQRSDLIKRFALDARTHHGLWRDGRTFSLVDFNAKSPFYVCFSQFKVHVSVLLKEHTSHHQNNTNKWPYFKQQIKHLLYLFNNKKKHWKNYQVQQQLKVINV